MDVTTREFAAIRSAQWKQESIIGRGKRVGLASGAFDLLHAGHVDYLSQLSQTVDRLIVAVSCDEIVRLKGNGRPIIPEAQRRSMVDSLRCVDLAFIFHEYGDEKNLIEIKPDIFGRGDGHTLDMYEKATISRLGIEVALIHSPRITSTTEIIDRIKSL